MIVRDCPEGVEILAPAKLNLFLEIHGKRPDGYHDLESLMVAIDLHDTLRFRTDSTGRIRLTCDDPTLPTGQENLVVRAAEAMRQAVPGPEGVTIDLTKRIPAQAGLAGGSSDAAATLVGLNQLWKCGLTTEDLAAVGAGLGSDVPFFLHGDAAICRGRGERVEPIPIAGRFHFVLARPNVGVSTAEVYRRLTVPRQPRPLADCLEAWLRGDVPHLGRSLFNRLQEVAEHLAPDLIQVRDALMSLGSLIDGHLMSGSGSAYFGLCRDRAAAHLAARRLETLGQGSVRVVTCGA